MCEPDRVIRYRLDLAYAGTGFAGWADQPGLRTVQGVLEGWIGAVLRLPEPARLTCAGRTDAGVHARGQVAQLDLDEAVVRRVSAGLRSNRDDRTTPADRVARLLVGRLARVLPDDLVVRSVAVAPPGFDARFSAVWRRYVYRLWDRAVPPDPLQRTMIATCRSRAEGLDLAAMNRAARGLLGLRDFAAFCKRRDGATTIRTLLRLDGERIVGGPLDGLIEFTVQADAFCHAMVRSLIGGLVAVGAGRRDADWLAGLAPASRHDPARGREGAIQVMPAAGLTLEEVGYPAPEELARRASVARALRVLADPAESWSS